MSAENRDVVQGKIGLIRAELVKRGIALLLPEELANILTGAKNGSAYEEGAA
ncbi:MAG: hypothetical protein M3305_10525 [Actinomycetota bacterium]|nr:hypothetical protein [Actinomycetota bacterium]